MNSHPSYYPPNDPEYGTHTPDHTPDNLDTIILASLPGLSDVPIQDHIDLLTKHRTIKYLVLKKRRRVRTDSYIINRLFALCEAGHIEETIPGHIIRTPNGKQAYLRGIPNLTDIDPIEYKRYVDTAIVDETPLLPPAHIPLIFKGFT